MSYCRILWYMTHPETQPQTDLTLHSRLLEAIRSVDCHILGRYQCLQVDLQASNTSVILVAVTDLDQHVSVSRLW